MTWPWRARRSTPDCFDLVHKRLHAFFIHMVFKHAVVFECRTHNCSVGDGKLFCHVCWIYAGVGENRGSGDGIPDVFEDLLVGLCPRGQARDA